MKLAVIYDSKTGNTRQAGEWIAAGMNEVSGVEAKAFSIKSVEEEFVKEAKGVVIGSPSYAALLTPDMHSWLFAASSRLKFAGKLAGAFATEQYSDGGGDIVIQNILSIEMVSGMLFYSSGGAYGDPIMHLGPVAVNNNKEKHNGMEHFEDSFKIYGERFARKAVELFG